MALDVTYPVHFSVDFPAQSQDRLTAFFRPIVAIPILIVLGTMRNLLFPALLLMMVFRQKYPRWWFDWNLELLRFSNRVGVYLALMTDRYPSTDEHQCVHLDIPYPNAQHDLNRWLPLVKWFLVIPHYVVLALLYVGLVVAVIAAWVAILVTGHYPRAIFEFVEGVIRWHNRVIAYAFALTTDRYPPFRLAP